jgi:peptidyl-prolyl cis-trans isomerase C
VKSFVREPLVHFVLIGAVLFAVDAMRSEAEPQAAAPAAPTTPALPSPAPGAGSAGMARSIVIDDATRAQIASNAQRRLGRPPSAQELANETQLWIDEEILYREAIARGLERDDPVIHQRVAGKMSFVLEQSLAVPEPTDAELRAYFEQHRAQWSIAEHVDFTHVFVSGSDAASEARLGELEAALAAGAAPERLGDRFTGGHRYRGRKPADLALAFGDEFASGLTTQAPGTWVRRRSRHGLHLVRIDGVDAGRSADFAAARLDVRKSWLEAKQRELLADAMKQLRSTWSVTQK